MTMARCARKERPQLYLRANGSPLLITPDGTKKFPQDQGWGWVVCCGAFVVSFLTIGQQNSAGVIYSVLKDEYSTQRGETAWVASLASSMMYLFAAVATSLTARFGSRLVVITGSLISAAGLLASSFSTSLQLLYATYGIVWGLGTCLGLFPSLVILTKYFNKRLALANGIGLAGAAVGSMIYGPFIQVVSSKFGVPMMFRLLAALQSLMFLSALTFRPVPKENQNRKTKMFDCSSFSNKGFVIWTTSLSIFMLVFLVPFVHLVSFAEDKGVPKIKASFLSTLMAIGIFVGSIIFGIISDFPRLNRLKVCQLTFLSIAVSTTLVSIATKYEWIGLYAFAFGVFDGCFEMLVPVITKDITGALKCAQAIGTLYSFLAFPKTLGPPIAGWIFDASKSYRYSFYVTGAVTTLAVVVTFLLSWFELENYDKIKKLATNSSESEIRHADRETPEALESILSNDSSDMLQEPSSHLHTSSENPFHDNSKESALIERLTVV